MKYNLLACILMVFCMFAASAQTVPLQEHQYITSLLHNDILFDTSRISVSTAAVPEHNEESWQSWETVENFTYGKDRGSLPMITDLNALHPYFRDRINELIRISKEQGIELAVVESFRTHAKQAEYFGMGRKYTRSKGGKSKHQYGLAVIVVPIIDSVAVWDNTMLWRKIGVIGEKLGLRWGGRWRAPYDPAHFEWSGGINTYQLAAGAQPFIPKSKAASYPCLSEELEQLQQYWEEWETEQAVFARVGKTASGSIASSSGAGQNP